MNAYIPARIPLDGVAHQNGTVRLGRDPKASALDVHCKAHDVDNLDVVDASFFPSSGSGSGETARAPPRGERACREAE